MEYAQKLLSTRGGTVALGGAAALLAGLILVLYLNQYRTSVSSAGEPVTILVAKSLIEKGTPGNVVGKEELFQVADTPKSEVLDGALTDPSTLRGRVAVNDVLPGQQLTLADFSASTTDALGTQLAGNQRAIAVPFDNAHGLIGQIETGDRVDIYASLGTIGATGRGSNTLKILAQDVLVLEAPASAGRSSGANATSNVVLRTSPEQSAKIAFTVDNGKVWIVLRPRGGSPRTKPGIVTEPSVLLGTNPATVYSTYRKRFGRALLGGSR